MKEALLLAVGSINYIIRRYDDLASSIEPMLKAHVFPDLTSPNSYVKSRAIWCYAEFGYFKYTDNQHIQETMKRLY